MGDEILLVSLEVIQGGLLQMDFHNTTKDEYYRVFVEPKQILEEIGESMHRGHTQYMDDYISSHK